MTPAFIPPLDCANEIAIREVFPADKAWESAEALAPPELEGEGGDLEDGAVVLDDVA